MKLAGLLLLLPISAFAANHAVLPSTACTNNGDGSTWGCAASSGAAGAFKGIPATLVRGDVYYLGDGTYASYTFNQSGTTTVELRKAQSYDHGPATGWNTGTMGSAQAVFATYRQLAINSPGLIINGNGQQTTPGCGGNVGSDPSVGPGTPTDCGIKIDNSACTSTSANACSDGISDGGVLSGGWTMEYVELLGAGNATSENYMIRADGSTGTSISHIYLHHYGSVCVVGNGTTNIVFNLNYIWRNQIVAGSSPAHGQCFEVGTNANGGTVSNNVFRDVGGTAAMATFNVSGTSDSWKFYNNVVWTTPGFTPLFGTTDGMVACINSHSCTNLNVSQNTFVNMGNNSSIENEVGGSATVQNNLWYTSGHTPTFGPSGTYTQDHNSFLASGTSCAAGTANVCNNVSGNPFVSWTTGNFTLASDAADWNNRVSLGSPYTADAAGNTFTTDRGAYQFIATNTVATPTASPAAGTYSGAIYATLSTITSGAAICYTLDGTTPTAATPGTCDGLTYSTPILIPSTTTVKAIGTLTGNINSSVSSTAYTISNTTWYVDPVNGGPRYSPQNATAASCDGRGTVAFNPTGPANQHCPYQVGRYLWNDVFTYNNTQWIIQGGDTVEFRNADVTHPTEFSGSTGNFGDGCWGIGPQCSPPPVPDGTSGQHTVFRGQNYAACSTTNSLGITVADPTKISYLWAGGGTGQLFDLSTSHYVDISCMQLRDHSSCNGINLSCAGTEWAGRGIWSGAVANNANITLTNMQITGFQSRGIIGNIGGPWTLNNVEISFNGSAGWDLDPGFGSTRDSVNGVVVMNNTIVSWNGCSRQYPDVNPVPVQALSCTYDTDGGYGDGIGTPPDTGILSWTLNHSLLSYNTQDAIDLGHLLSGNVIYTGNILFGNAGGAMKVGNATNLTEWNNFSEGNCTAMAQPIAGAVSNYNAVISGQNIDLCRAGGDQNTFNYDPTLGHTLTADVEFNTFVGTGATVMDAQCFNGPCVPTTGYTFKFSNNAVLGYTNGITTPTPPYPYNSGLAPGMFNNLATTTQANNLFSGLRSCPANGSDISPTCALSPAFVSQPASPITAESQLANFNFLPAGGGALIHAGVFNASVPLDYYGVTRPNPPTVGAAEPAGGTVTVATPTAAPAAGTYSSTQNVVLSTTTGGATICYRTDGTNPAATTPGTCDAGSTTYAGAISVPVTTTIKALGTLSGATNSSLASFAYVISTPATATPTCTPAGGTYSSTQSVTCSSTTPASTTFCTVDGSTPTTSSPVCTAIPVATTLAVRAISSASGFTNSAILTQNYTITTSTVATPTALPGTGTFSTAQSVVLSNATSGAAICFTTDGSTPTAPTAGTCSGGTTQTYSTAIPVSTTTTINCLGTKAGSLNSPMANFVYTIGPNQVTIGGSITISGKVPLQ